MPAPGEVFDNRFRVERELGGGGFANVYRATDLAQGRTVALKILKADERPEEQRRRFVREARLLSALDEPHTVRLLAHGESEGGELYLVFQLVEGRDLGDVLAERKVLEPEIAEHVLRQICASLGHAHRTGVLHRDLKPDNIRVRAMGDDPWVVTLLDFGIARPLNSWSPAITRTGELIGTPRYMSPEQLTDRPLTAASDIYSLGIILFEMLFGSKVLSGHSIFEQIDRLRSGYLIAADTPDDPRSRLRDLAQKMTARNADERPQSISAVLAALDMEAQATAPPPREFPTTAVVSAIGAVVVLLVVAFFAQRSDPGTTAASPPSTPAPTQTPTPATPPAPSPSPDLPSHTAGGCGVAPPFVGQGRATDPSRIGRNWPTYVPTTYDRDVLHPLVVLLGEPGLRPRRFLDEGGFIPLAEKHRFVVVAPFVRAAAKRDAPDAASEVLAMIDELSLQWCIDRARVFVVAQGDGGRIGVNLSCRDVELAGIAISAFRSHTADWCRAMSPQPARAMPMITLSPRNSGLDPIRGGEDCHGETVFPLGALQNYWRGRNRCGQTETVRTVGFGTCVSWPCSVPLEDCSYPGGHAWPGIHYVRSSVPNCDGPPADFPSAETVWSFFAGLSAP